MICCRDGAQRTHVLEVDLPAAYPDKPPVFTADLPEPLVLEWQPGWGIKHALEAFHVAVARYQVQTQDLLVDVWICTRRRAIQAGIARRFSLSSALFVVSCKLHLVHSL